MTSFLVLDPVDMYMFQKDTLNKQDLGLDTAFTVYCNGQAIDALLYGLRVVVLLCFSNTLGIYIVVQSSVVGMVGSQPGQTQK